MKQLNSELTQKAWDYIRAVREYYDREKAKSQEQYVSLVEELDKWMKNIEGRCHIPKPIWFIALLRLPPRKPKAWPQEGTGPSLPISKDPSPLSYLPPPSPQKEYII